MGPEHLGLWPWLLLYHNTSNCRGLHDRVLLQEGAEWLHLVKLHVALVHSIAAFDLALGPLLWSRENLAVPCICLRLPLQHLGSPVWMALQRVPHLQD